MPLYVDEGDYEIRDYGAKNVHSYAVKNKNEVDRQNSQSGGIFSVLSDDVLFHEGVIYGCVLKDDFMAVHDRAETSEIRNKMRGSKYIQSRIGDTFKQVRDDLQKERKVLFSGTSCQVAGLKSFLNCEYPNLLCVDIVCHGVPSSLVWQQFLKWQEKRNGGNVISAVFRNKKDFGWNSHIETIELKKANGKVIKVNSEIFKRIFYGHCILRPCCFKCPYKDIVHPSDITIADYWGVEKAAPGFSDEKGVSLVLINSDKGYRAFDNVKTKIHYQETCIEDSMQPPLEAPFDEPINREQFWKDFHTKPFNYVAKHYGRQKFKASIKRAIVWAIKLISS